MTVSITRTQFLHFFDSSVESGVVGMEDQLWEVEMFSEMRSIASDDVPEVKLRDVCTDSCFDVI